jgi:hypothetical protein
MARTLGKVGLGLLVVAVVGSLRAGDGPPKFTLSDADVLSAIAKGPRVPKGFDAEDPKAGPNESASVSWLRQLKKDGRRVVYVSAKSLDEAKAMTQAFLDKSKLPADAKKILTEETTPAYYQFKTKQKSGDATHWTFHRVWRGDFFQPGDDLGSRYLGENGTFQIGKLTGKRDEATVRRLAEMLWWNDNHNLDGAYVLAAAKSWDDRSSFNVTLFTAQVVKGDFGVGDVVHVIRWDLSVGRASGQVSQTIKGLRRVKGKRDGGKG